MRNKCRYAKGKNERCSKSKDTVRFFGFKLQETRGYIFEVLLRVKTNLEDDTPHLRIPKPKICS